MGSVAERCGASDNESVDSIYVGTGLVSTAPASPGFVGSVSIGRGFVISASVGPASVGPVSGDPAAPLWLQFQRPQFCWQNFWLPLRPSLRSLIRQVASRHKNDC